jgi:WD40 repeat protein
MMSQAAENEQVQMATIQQEFKTWEYVGRHRAHWDEIVGLSFIGQGSQESPHRLFTIGRDRRIVEYDFANSAYLDGVLLKMHEKIERTAKPTSFVWTTQENRPYFFVANTEGKIRYWSGDSLICRKTTLAPSFGGDLTHLIFTDQIRPALVYATNSCVLGLILFPTTGNPHESMGLIVHPASIDRISMSKDESRILVTSGVDSYIEIFTSHSEHLEAASLLASRDGDAFIAMLDGGEEGALYQEITDYFYSSMLRVEGELTDKPHEIPQVVPIEEIVPLMCSLGYYPTQFESELLRNENFFSHSKGGGSSDEDGTRVLDLQTFLRLFLNHRPVFPPNLDDIENVFSILGIDSEGRTSVKDIDNALQSLEKQCQLMKLINVLNL